MGQRLKIGVTGHQHFEPRVCDWISANIDDLIAKTDIECGITSLARGADQLFAERLHHYNLSYIAIIPCLNYIDTFNNLEDRDNFQNLLATSRYQETLHYDKPSEPAFWAAGKRVVILSDIIVAVWNGLSAKGLGGTADVVKFALENGKKVIHLNTLYIRFFSANLR